MKTEQLVKYTNATPKEFKQAHRIIDRINKLWDEKKICDKLGFGEEDHKLTDDEFKIIVINLKKGEREEYPVSLNAYKHYRGLRRLILGLK